MFASHSDPVPVTIVDISRGGLGIELHRSVEAGQPLAISSGPVFVLGTVRHCRSILGDRFHAGIEMQHVLERPMEAAVESSPGLLGRVFGTAKGWRARRDSNPRPIGSKPLLYEKSSTRIVAHFCS